MLIFAYAICFIYTYVVSIIHNPLNEKWPLRKYVWASELRFLSVF